KVFDFLKERMCKAPILIHPNFDKPFILYTDASGTRLGAVLSQIGDDKKEHVIAYASRSLTKAEANYSITDQECLAVVWGIEYFKHYLISKPFTVITDHSALKWLQTAKMPEGRRARWIMKLQQYDFEIKHRPGKSNANADALSRLTYPTEVFTYTVAQEIGNAIAKKVYENLHNDSDAEPSNKIIELTDTSEDEEYDTAYDAETESDDERPKKRTKTTTPTSPIAYSCCGEIYCECVFSEDSDISSIDPEEYGEFYRDLNLVEAIEEAVNNINEYIKGT